MARRLFRRHITRRSQNIEGVRDGALLFDQASQTKIGQMRLTVAIQQNISGLNIAMQNTVLVCELNRAGDFDQQLCRLADRHCLSPNGFVELTTLYEFHAEIAGAVAFADLINRNNSGMLQTCRCLCFLAKSSQMRSARPSTEPDRFKGNGSIQTFLPGKINYTLSATTDLFEQFIVPKFHLGPARLLTASIFIIIEFAKGRPEKAGATKPFRRVGINDGSAFSADSV